MNENKRLQFEIFVKNILIVLGTFLTLVFSFFFSVRYIFPGFFNPLVPHHTDIYDYGFDSKGFLLQDFLKGSRFIGDFVVNLFSFENYKVTILFAIFLSMVNVYIVIKIIESMTKSKISILLTFVFAILLFSHPGFYISYSFDIYSTISLFFVLLTIYLWYRLDGQNTRNKVIILTLLTLCAFASKETYVPALIIFWFCQTIINRKTKRTQAITLLVFTFLLFIGLWLRSKTLGVAFTSSSSDPYAPYFISLDPKSILKILKYYLSGWSTWITLIGILGTFLITKRERKFEFLMFLFMGISAYLPYTILPNHVVPHYTWVGVPLSFAALLLVGSQEDSLLKKFGFLLITLVTIANIFLPFGYPAKYKENQWAVKPELVNQNIHRSMEYIVSNVLPGEKVLITGLYANEENPFKSIYYLKNLMPYFADFTLISTGAPDRSSYVKRIQIDQVNIIEFDKVIVYNEDGLLLRVMTKDDIAEEISNNLLYDNVLNPNLGALIAKSEANPEDWYTQMVIGMEYEKLGEKSLADNYYSKAIESSNGSNPWPSYYKGALLLKSNKPKDALIFLSKALELEPNNVVFNQAMINAENVLNDLSNQSN